MTHYRIVATGHDSGVIEVVPKAETASQIQLKMGGATTAFKKGYLLEWLIQHNPVESKFFFFLKKFSLHSQQLTSKQSKISLDLVLVIV